MGSQGQPLPHWRGARGGAPRGRTLPRHTAPSPVLPGVPAVLWHLAPPRQWGARARRSRMWAYGREAQECLCPLVWKMPSGPSPETIPTGIYPDGLRQRSHHNTTDTWPHGGERQALGARTGARLSLRLPGGHTPPEAGSSSRQTRRPHLGRHGSTGVGVAGLGPDPAGEGV